MLFILINTVFAQNLVRPERNWSEWTDCSSSCSKGVRCRIFQDEYSYNIPTCEVKKHSGSPLILSRVIQKNYI